MSTADLQERYDKAIQEWCFARVKMPGLTGMLFGKAWTLGELLGYDAVRISGDLVAAKNEWQRQIASQSAMGLA